MKSVVLAMFLFGCSAAGQSSSESVVVLPPPEDCSYSFSPDVRLVNAVQKAAARWIAATGCDISISDSGVPWVVEEHVFRNDGSEAPGATEGDRTKVKIHARTVAGEADIYRTALHEMGHAMWANHVDTYGIMSGTGDYITVIDEISLSEVCSVNHCVSFQTED